MGSAIGRKDDEIGSHKERVVADGIERSVDGAGLYNLVGGPQRQMYVGIPRKSPNPAFHDITPFS